MKTVKFAYALTLLAALISPGVSFAQTDPGVQGGKRCATVGGVTTCTGDELPSVRANDNPGILAFFQDGQRRFQDVESVATQQEDAPSGHSAPAPSWALAKPGGGQPETSSQSMVLGLLTAVFLVICGLLIARGRAAQKTWLQESQCCTKLRSKP